MYLLKYTTVNQYIWHFNVKLQYYFIRVKPFMNIFFIMIDSSVLFKFSSSVDIISDEEYSFASDCVSFKDTNFRAQPGQVHKNMKI